MSTTAQHILAEELKTYDSLRGELLKTARGKWAVIKGNRLVGLFGDQSEAIDEGYRVLGYVPMLVKQVAEQDEVLFIY